MFKYIFLVANLALLTLGAPTAKETCSRASGPCCSCPAGTNYQASTSYATIGASAKDVKAIAGSFFNTDWFGHSSYNLTGIDNTVGAIRTLSGEIPGAGYLTFFEALYAYDEKRDGSFTHAYELVEVPIRYNNSLGVGEFYGDWDIVQVRAKGRSRTDITWTIYACFTVDGGFTPFHESAINNITSILQTQGKLKELTTPVYSVDYAVESVFAKYRAA